MVLVGGHITKTYPLAPFGNHNLLCVLIGSGELIWAIFVKFMPLKMFQCFNFDETPMTEDEIKNSTIGSLKKGSSFRKKNKEK